VHLRRNSGPEIAITAAAIDRPNLDHAAPLSDEPRPFSLVIRRELCRLSVSWRWPVCLGFDLPCACVFFDGLRAFQR
jgi:hypothetical protein